MLMQLHFRRNHVESKPFGKIRHKEIHHGDDEQGVYRLRTWGRKAPESELAAVVERLSQETIPIRLFRYLQVFLARTHPAPDDTLLAFADHHRPMIRRVAYSVLSRLDDPRVRQLALARLQPEPMSKGALSMFEASYRPGDHHAIERAIFIPENVDDLHRLALDLVNIFGRHPLPDARDLMLFAYEHSPCGICRESSVRTLSRIGDLPSWLREEAAFDASPLIHKLATGVPDEE